MKLFITTLAFFLVGTLAHAETWMTDSKKAIEIAKADKKPLVIWFAKSGSKFGDDFKNDMTIGKVVLLKIEHGTKDAEEWKDSNIAKAAAGNNMLFEMNLNSTDLSGKPSWERAQSPLASATVLSWSELNSWYGNLPQVQQQQQVQQPQAVAVGQGQAPVVAGTYANTLAFAQANIGRRVGNGGCNDLGAGGAQIGTVSAGGAVTGNIVPGAIFEMLNFSISSTDGATWTSPKNQHYGVVESYDPAGRTVTILHQNTQGGRAGGQFVTRTTFRLDTLTRGSIIVKAGN